MVGAAETLSNVLSNFGLQACECWMSEKTIFVLGEWFMPAGFKTWQGASIESDILEHFQDVHKIVKSGGEHLCDFSLFESVMWG